MKPDAPATARNREAILGVLKEAFADVSSVLEIGSGTGQHAVYFGRKLPHLSWQTSDLQENHRGIEAWLAAEGPGNVLPPITLDVLSIDRIEARYDAIFSANTAHIMSFDAVERMFRLVGGALNPANRFCLYGPFNVGGTYTSEGNRRFDASLRAQDARMGIRDVEEMERLAAANGLAIVNRYAMPANNLMIWWEKREGE